VRRGAYVLREATGAAKMILISTGSELHLAVAAAEQLEAAGTPTRVVSMPCPELFGEQDAAYRESVLPAALRARVAIEAGVSLGWDRWSGTDGAIIAMDRFGASAPAPTLFKEFGFTPERIVEIAKGVLAGSVHGVVPTPHLHDGHQVR
jgi:transketolase